MKAKVKNLIARIHKDWWKIAQIFLWIFLFVKYKGVRDFFFGHVQNGYKHMDMGDNTSDSYVTICINISFSDGYGC